MKEKKFTTLEELPDILSAQHISNYLGVSRTTVYTLFQTNPDRGGIPSFNVGNSKRADKSDFIRWIEARKKEHFPKSS